MIKQPENRNKAIYIPYLIFFMLLTSCQSKNYERLDNGMVIRLSQKSDNEARLVQLEVITEDIIHVSATPRKNFSREKSLIIEEKNRSPVEWSLEKDGNNLLLNTARVSAHISLITGEAIFYDKEGNVRLREREGQGKTFEPYTLDAKTVYKIRQVFDSPADEAFYGLGQHQNDVMNYKGHNVELMQQNTVAVVPFLVSSKNYGILWDNYSLSRFGDPREHQHLNTLKTYTADGKPGGLTARYFVDGDRENLFSERIEPAINYEFREHMSKWPAGFPVEGALIQWSGFIESEFSGLHKFLLYSSSYTKVWLDGKRVAANWRQVWLPGTDHIDLHMKKGKKYSIKVEWIPDGFGDGPYIAVKWLPPVDESEQNNLSLFSEAAEEIDYYYINGNNLDEVISGYREITGKARLMPKWAMGLFQSRERYQSQAQMMEVVAELRRRKIPFDNIVLDWRYWQEGQWGSHEFDPQRFPDPEGMINDIHEKYNARIMISVWPKFYEGIRNYQAFNENGWLYQENIKKQTSDWLGHVYTFYDAFDPQARQLFWEQINTLLFQKGIDAWWMDATEPEIYSNVSNREKASRVNPTALGHGTTYINAYSLMNSKGVYEGQRKEKPNQRVFILTRSAFAGQQRFASATWSGDVAARWRDLKQQIPAGLNFSLSGIPYWTTDIGGFAVERRFAEVNGDDEEWRELMTRWLQFGTFCPIFRIHGQYPYREIYHVAPEAHIAYKTMVKFDKLRYRLMPYIYSLAGMTYHNDYTIMRALIMDFAADKKVYNLGDQYMFGPTLMVCPVYEYRAVKRDVYLPENSGWYDLYTGEYYAGGQTLQAEAPLSKIPLFAREGSILPIGPAIQYAMEKPADPLWLLVYTGKDALFVLYEDEEVNYNYEKGSFAKIPIEYHQESQSLTIGERIGSFPGMLHERTIQVVWISENKAIPLNFERKPDAVLKYDGQRQTIVMK